MNDLIHNERNYDLEERTAILRESIITFAKKLPHNVVTIPVISQLFRSGTSIGANYCEADEAESRSDFNHKIGICKKESRETKHWLRMISTAVPEVKEKARLLWQETHELTLIFNAIIKTTKNNVH